MPSPGAPDELPPESEGPEEPPRGASGPDGNAGLPEGYGDPGVAGYEHAAADDPHTSWLSGPDAGSMDSGEEPSAGEDRPNLDETSGSLAVAAGEGSPVPRPHHEDDDETAGRRDVPHPAVSGEGSGHFDDHSRRRGTRSALDGVRPLARPAEAAERQDTTALEAGLARNTAARIRDGQLRQVAAESMAITLANGVLQDDRSGSPASAAEAVSRDWSRAGSMLADDDGIALREGAEQLEQERRADSLWYRQVCIEALGEKHIRLSAEIRRAEAEIADPATAAEQLRLARRVIRDLGASLAAARPPGFEGYAGMRREIAIDVLRSLSLQAPGTTSLRGDLQATLQSVIDQPAQDRFRDRLRFSGCWESWTRRSPHSWNSRQTLREGSG